MHYYDNFNDNNKLPWLRIPNTKKKSISFSYKFLFIKYIFWRTLLQSADHFNVIAITKTELGFDLTTHHLWSWQYFEFLQLNSLLSWAFSWQDILPSSNFRQCIMLMVFLFLYWFFPYCSQSSQIIKKYDQTQLIWLMYLTS